MTNLITAAIAWTNLLIHSTNSRDFNKPFATFQNIIPTKSYGFDYCPTNVLVTFYYEPVVVKTNGVWEIRFKDNKERKGKQ